MALITKSYTFSAGATIVASEHNSNFDTLYNCLNGNIDNANISSSAAIVDTKLAQLTTANKVAASAVSWRWFDVKNYGAVGDGLTDDTAAIQAAIDAAGAAGQAGTNNGGGSRGCQPIVYFPSGIYSISSTLTLYGSYSWFKGDNAIIMKDSAGFTGTYALSSDSANAWRVNIEGLQFQDFTTAIYLDSNNVNSGYVNIIKCGFFYNTTAIHIDCQSSQILIQDCMWRSNVHELYLETGICVVRGGWISRGTLTDDYDGGIVNAGQLYIYDLCGVPSEQTVTEPCWIKNTATGFISCINMRFGGETGSHAAVNNYAAADLSSPYLPNRVMLSQCWLYGTPTIRLFDIPNQIVLLNNSGFPNDSKLIDWSSSIDGAAQTALITALGSPITASKVIISIIGNSLEAYNAVPENLRYITSDSRQVRVKTQDGTTYPSVLKFELLDSTIVANDSYGNIEWHGHDAGTNANGIRASISAESVDENGSADVVIATATANAAVADAIRISKSAVRLKEMTTPNAIADWGAIYTKSDNKLYFQDGAGTEHEISFA